MMRFRNIRQLEKIFMMKRLILSFLILLLFISPALARIYESPYSQEISGMPGADNEPPVTTITISQPQLNIGDNLYISNQTLISFSAIDYGIVPSGVNYTEYKIDNESSWTKYTEPFNLTSYSDSQHTIYYRSIDKMQNTEQEKTTTLVLDKTPPVTTITASDPLIEGIVNIISPRTRFTLSSTDNLSGVKEIQYSIDGSAYQTYIANFSLSGMNAGLHTITYKAIDNLGNEEAEKTLTVRLIAIDVIKGISSEPVVLGGVWGATAQAQTALNNLISILSVSGLNYYIPQTSEEFKELLRAGRYNTYLFMDFNESGLNDELKEAINFSNGLVYIKTLPNEIPSLQDVFGVKLNGMSTNKDLLVNLAESEISKASTLPSKDKAVKTTITSPTAQGLGYVTDKKETYPVIVSNQYGRGKAMLFSFDLLNNLDKNKVRDLILNSINHVKPTEHYINALNDEPVNITIQNSTEPVDIKVTEALPSGTGADSIKPDASISGNTISWQLSLNPNESRKLSYYLLLPDTSGNYQTNTELRYGNYGEYRLYGNYSITLNVWKNSSELLQDIITYLQGLQVSGSNADHISSALYCLNLIKGHQGITRPEAQLNIDNILTALKELNKVSIDVSDIRLKLDELLKIWQKQWSLLLGEKE